MSDDRDHTHRRFRRRRRCAATLLALYVLALTALVIGCALQLIDRDLVSWRPPNAIWIVQVAAEIGFRIVTDLLLFLVLAFLTGAACAPQNRRASLIRRALHFVAAVGVSFVITLAAHTLMQGTPLRLPHFLSTGFLAVVCLWGSWLGASWIRAGSQAGWLLTQSLLSLFAFSAGAVVLAWFAISPAPLKPEQPPVTSDDRRRLVEKFQEHDPRGLAADETTTLTISEQDLNQLVSWALSLLPGEHRAELQLNNGGVSASAALQLPAMFVIDGYFNLTAAGQIITRDGELGFVPASFRLGELQVPDWLLASAGPLMVGSEWRNQATEPFFQSLQTVEIVEGQGSVTYGRLEAHQGFARDTLVGLGMMEDLEEATSAHVTRLIALADNSSQLSFRECIEAAFDEASSRSVDGDAARQNRAAILAMGYVLGHPRIRTLVGPEVPQLSGELLRRFRRVTLSGRRDWTQHYTVSGALQVLSNALASMDVGLLKEELDADGGSGFSFGDLLADRAGTMLAVRATESDSAAAAMQRRIAGGFVVSDFLPSAADLPEGLSSAEFQRRFGGVGGVEYQRLLDEIDRRIADCPAYRAE